MSLKVQENQSALTLSFEWLIIKLKNYQEKLFYSLLLQVTLKISEICYMDENGTAPS